MNQALWIVGSPDADGLAWLFVCRVSAYRHACGWIDGLQELFFDWNLVAVPAGSCWVGGLIHGGSCRRLSWGLQLILVTMLPVWWCCDGR